MAIEKQPSCDDPAEPALLPVAEAKRRIAELVPALQDVENVNTVVSAGRVLARAILSPLNVPAATNSAMDGYAISHGDIPQSGEQSLDVVGECYAGRPYPHKVNPGEAVRIFTGGVMPHGTDTVVIQEHVAVDGGKVRIDHDVQAMRNVRLAGEDIKQGETVLEAGRKLSAADIGLIASLGISEVVVTRRLKVAFFSTGDEVQSLDKAITEGLPDGMVYDSNRHTLRCLLQALGVEAIDLGIVKDTFDDTYQALKTASEQADVVVSSGGISAGDADYVTKAFHQLGDVAFWKIAMRPGRPLASGKIGEAAFFGLPGNPVAVMVTFLAFVQPAIKRRMGMLSTEPMAIPARASARMKKTPGRMEYQRGIMSVSDDGAVQVALTGKQGAGRLSSMSVANCLIVLSEQQGTVEVGDTVSVWPFDGLL